MKRLFVTLLVVVLTATGCSKGGEPASDVQKGTKLRLVTHDSFVVSDDVLQEFTKTTGITVEIIHSGDAGAALNQAILTKNNPLGDVFFGVDNTFLSRALDKDIFTTYKSPLLDKVPDKFELDKSHKFTPVDHGEVCINYDKQRLASAGIVAPRSFEDLAKPTYKDMLVVENPASSSPGLAFMLATVAHFGDGWENYWSQLRANGVQITNGWEEAYNSAFSAGPGAGDKPLVGSYASSPSGAVYGIEPEPKVSPVGVVESTCFSQIEFAGILKGSANEKAAQKLIDFFLSKPFQEDIPPQMFVFPVNEDAVLPVLFKKFAVMPKHPLELPPATIERNREQWIQRWTTIVLK